MLILFASELKNVRYRTLLLLRAKKIQKPSVKMKNLRKKQKKSVVYQTTLINQFKPTY